ncbi:MAG TPA: hypothetical protein VLT87_11175 [Thermoanaerobaculia bacterium]|nr:hypothetical protein [Thermoanaerobaculia bacterium]
MRDALVKIARLVNPIFEKASEEDTVALLVESARPFYGNLTPQQVAAMMDREAAGRLAKSVLAGGIPYSAIRELDKEDELVGCMNDSADVIGLSALLSVRMHRDVLEGKVKPLYEEENALRRLLKDRGVVAWELTAKEYRERAAGLLWLADEAEKRERPTTTPTFNGIVNEAGGPLLREAK